MASAGVLESNPVPPLPEFGVAEYPPFVGIAPTLLLLPVRGYLLPRAQLRSDRIQSEVLPGIDVRQSDDGQVALDGRARWTGGSFVPAPLPHLPERRDVPPGAILGEGDCLLP